MHLYKKIIISFQAKIDLHANYMLTYIHINHTTHHDGYCTYGGGGGGYLMGTNDWNFGLYG